MAYGGWGAFAENLAKGFERGQAMAERSVEAERRRKQYARDDALEESLSKVPKIGDVRGGRVVSSQSFSTAEEANAALKAAREKTTPIDNFSNAPLATPNIDPAQISALIGPLPEFDAKGNLVPPKTIPAPAKAPAPKAAAPALGLPTPGAPTPAPAAPAAALAGALETPAPNTPATPPAPGISKPQTYGEARRAGENEFGVNLDKALVFYDPVSKSYKITDEDSAIRTTELDAFSYAAAAYAANNQFDKAINIRAQANQLIESNAKAARTQALGILDSAMLSPGGINETAVNDALAAMNRDDNITLDAQFKMVKTDKGYTLAAAPDGTNLPFQPVPQFGVYESPQQVYQALRGIVAGDGSFAALQQQIFAQTTELKRLAISQGQLDESIRHNKVGEGLDRERLGLSRAELDFRRSEARAARAARAERQADAGNPKWSRPQRIADPEGGVIEYRTAGDGSGRTQTRNPALFGTAWVDTEHTSPAAVARVRRFKDHMGPYSSVVVQNGVPGIRMGDRFWRYDEPLPTVVRAPR